MVEIGVVCVAVVAAILAGAYRRTWLARRPWTTGHAQQWTLGHAQISGTSIRTHHAEEGTSYVLSVKYVYTVDGHVYEGHRIGPNEFLWHQDREILERERHRYPAGTWMTISYDPGDPCQSMLDPAGGRPR